MEEIMYNRSPRTIMVNKGVTIKVAFFSDYKIKIKGKIFDISERGVCILIDEMIEEPEIGSEGILIIERFGKFSSIPSTVKWIDPDVGSLIRCMGVQTKYELIYSE